MQLSFGQRIPRAFLPKRMRRRHRGEHSFVRRQPPIRPALNAPLLLLQQKPKLIIQKRLKKSKYPVGKSDNLPNIWKAEGFLLHSQRFLL